MEKDLIRRSDAIKAIANLHILADEEKIFRVYANNPHSMTTDFEGTLIDAINAIKSIPSADRPQGEWIPMRVSSGRDSWKCSICGRRARGKLENLPYCHCGARMKGADDE